MMLVGGVNYVYKYFRVFLHLFKLVTCDIRVVAMLKDM